MAHDPAARYPAALEVAADLRRFQTGQLVSAYRYSTRELARRFVRRHRGAVIVAAALSLALAVAVAAGFVGVRRQARLAEAQRDRAQPSARKAERINREALATLRRLGAPDGEAGIAIRADLARVLQNPGKVDAAEALYREALALQRRIDGGRLSGCRTG